MRMTIGHLRLVGGARIVLLMTQSGGFFVMVRRLRVVERRRGMMRGAAELAGRGADNVSRAPILRHRIRWLGQWTEMVPGIVQAGFLSVTQCPQRMAVPDHRLMRGMGIILADLEMP